VNIRFSEVDATDPHHRMESDFEADELLARTLRDSASGSELLSYSDLDVQSPAKTTCGTLKRNKKCLCWSFLLTIFLSSVVGYGLFFSNPGIVLVSVQANLNVSSNIISGTQSFEVSNRNWFKVLLQKIDRSVYYKGSQDWYQLQDVGPSATPELDLKGLRSTRVQVDFEYKIRSGRAASAILYQCQNHVLDLGWVGIFHYQYLNAPKNIGFGPITSFTNCTIKVF